MLNINIDKIEKSFGFGKVLNKISFDIHDNDKIALVGENGSGKSTLLKIIAGIESKDTGNINIRNNIKVSYMPQIIDEIDMLVKDLMYQNFKDILLLKDKLDRLEKELNNTNALDKTILKYTKMQDDFIRLDGYNIDERIYKVIDEFNIKHLLDINFKDLSSGQKTLCYLCYLIINKPDILLLDEPTNYLDISSLEWLENYLNKYNGSLLIVSHDRYFIDKVCTKTILIENGKEVIFYGNYSYYYNENILRKENLLKNYNNQTKEINRLKESSKRLREFGKLGGNELFFRRAKSMEKRISKLNTLEKPINKKDLPISFDINNRTGEDVLTIKNFTFGYDQLLFSNANMFIKYKDKACLIGNNGVGKSTLIKKIINNEFKLGTNIKIGYLPQEITFPNEKIKLIDEAKKYFDGPLENLISSLNKFYFDYNNSNKRLDKLSGGERVRLLLFCLMEENSNFLILDEPTNHIDIETKEILEKALNDYNGTILFVSHDRYFINKVANKIFAIENEKIIEYLGNYDDYKNI